jgi:catechol 2,3-dioxygenase-like lactoylglutathione lyase family enzyme
MTLNQVTLPSRDVARACVFYRKLGLRPIVESFPRYARLALPDGGATVSLELVEARVAQPAPVIYFECDDLDERVAILRRLGIVFDYGPRDEPWLWREARLRDSDGNQLCLFWAGVNRLDPPWRIRADQPKTVE